MKIATAPRLVETTAQETRAFSIANNAKAFSILADKLYSDKPRAVVREIACNALDAAPDKPFKISVPSYLEPFLQIRDYGPGMSEDQILNLYTTFFDSSKANDNSQVGGFGLGSKSPFAYTDTFTVTSYQSGTKKVFVAFRGADHIPLITLAETHDTDEPDGLEVIVPVKKDDIHRFSVAAQAVLKWFPEGSFEPYGFTVEPTEWLLKTDTYGISAHNDHSALVGPVNYALDWKHQTKPHQSITPFFKIGEVDIAPSREHLSYDARTIAAIEARRQHIMREFQNDFRRKYHSLTPAQRLAWLAKFPSLWGLLPDAMYRGLPNHLPMPGYVSCWERKEARRRRGGTTQASKISLDRSHGGVTARDLEEAAFVFYDLPPKDRAPRIEARLNKHGQYKRYLICYGFESIEQMQHHFRGVDVDIIPLSSMEPLAKMKVQRGDLQMWEWDDRTRGFIQTYREPPKYALWAPMNGTESSFRKLSVFDDQVIFGFTKTAQRELDLTQWTSTEQFMQDEITRMMADPETVRRIGDRQFIRKVDERLIYVLRNGGAELWPELAPLTTMSDANRDVHKLEDLISRDLAPAIPPAEHKDLITLIKKTLRRQPILQLALDNRTILDHPAAKKLVRK